MIPDVRRMLKEGALSIKSELAARAEKAEDPSKKNYYDIINCAYSWLVYYSYNDKNYDKVKEYCNKVLSNYNEVKDDPDYNITEKESVSICLNYLDSIKKE